MPKSGTSYLLRLLLCLCSCFLLCISALSTLPRNGEEQMAERFIRLHVLANSDDEGDQMLKLQVRDAILQKLGPDPLVSTMDEAKQELLARLPELTKTAEDTIRSAGYSYPCTLTLTKEHYPARTYENITLPAGEYHSLRVLIGAAEGHNWWCVLFPPLCLSLAAETIEEKDSPAVRQVSAADTKDTALPDTGEQLLSAGFTPEEIRILSEGNTKKVIVKFRIVEWLRAWIRGMSANLITER